MHTAYPEILEGLRARPRRWLITGAAGFIGSNLVEALLLANQHVVGLDNFATGKRRTLDDLRKTVGEAQWRQFRFIEADIRDSRACLDAVDGADAVLHQAALGSVVRSIVDPVNSHAVNVDGFLNVLSAAKEAKVESFVYASSSAVYGDAPQRPGNSPNIDCLLSPYALTKCINELYADVFRRCYGFTSIGLRYFNVFGPRQDPEGAYAAVIPIWSSAMIAGKAVEIYGDGETTRDFCFVRDVVQANVLAAVAPPEASGAVYNVAANEQTSLKQLFAKLKGILAEFGVEYVWSPVHGPFRPGDVHHSRADISSAERLLGYRPTHTLEQGLRETMPWFLRNAPEYGASQYQICGEIITAMVESGRLDDNH